MARRRGRHGQTIELFPFLAILACVIGVLALLIAGLSLSAMDIDESGTEFARLARAGAVDRGRIDDLERRLVAAAGLAARVGHAESELRRRKDDAEALKELEPRKAALRGELDHLQKKRDELEKSLETMQTELADLENELRGRRTRLEDDSVELRGPRGGRGTRGLKPRFIECRKLELVLDADRPASQRAVVPRSRVGRDVRLAGLCSEVRRTYGGIVILLIREGAVATYEIVGEHLREAKVRFGKLPVPSAREIDFSGFGGR